MIALSSGVEPLPSLVFAEPDNVDARALLAQSYDQLGYQAESGPWRDVYLSGAYELRHGPPEQGMDIGLFADLLRETPVSLFFDTLAVRLNGPRADGVELSVRVVFTDLGEAHLLKVRNAVLHHAPAEQGDEAAVTLSITRDLFVAMITGRAGVRDTLFSDQLSVDGNVLDLVRFFGLLDKPDGRFPIVTP